MVRRRSNKRRFQSGGIGHGIPSNGRGVNIRNIPGNVGGSKLTKSQVRERGLYGWNGNGEDDETTNFEDYWQRGGKLRRQRGGTPRRTRRYQQGGTHGHNNHTHPYQSHNNWTNGPWDAPYVTDHKHGISPSTYASYTSGSMNMGTGRHNHGSGIGSVPQRQRGGRGRRRR